MMMRLVALIAVIGLARAETPFNHDVHNERVIGGNDAYPHSWKYQISLQMNLHNDGYYYHMCGGSLIGVDYIMTAAHCILSDDAAVYRVVVGEHDLYTYEGTEQFVGVERIIVHPAWNNDLGKGNDIALMKLSSPVYNNGFVEIANMPASNQRLPNNFSCHITGWGLVDFVGTIPDILQESPIAVVSHPICSTYEWWGSLALETMICAGGDGVISGCQGDSGGPLSCFTDGEWRVHGVVSYGPAGECNQYRKPTVFTRVASFQDWINSVSRLDG
ncbi:unnamed protein product [Merluccius merluccius]